MKLIGALSMGALMLAPIVAEAGGLTTPVAEPVVAEPPPPMRPNGDWTGPYGGLALGYGDIGSDGDALDGNGLIGGVFGGYRYDFGQWVAGGELDYDWANIDLDDVGDASLDSVARIKAQFGYDFGQTLLYATAGWAYADASVGDDSLNDWGYFGGVGLDYVFRDNWVVGAEVLYHQFDDFENSGIDLDATTVKARVAYRF